MELRDLYDENRFLTGEIIKRGDPIPKGKYINIVMIFIQNSKNEFLIQKRSPESDGTYATTSGHAKHGETSFDAIISEVFEEIGILLDKKELTILYSGKHHEKQAFFDIYYIKKDFEISDTTLQEEEVDSVEWMNINKIFNLIKNNKFNKRHAEQVDRVVKIFNKKHLEMA